MKDEKIFSLKETKTICRLMFANDYIPKMKDNNYIEWYKEFEKSFNLITSHIISKNEKRR